MTSQPDLEAFDADVQEHIKELRSGNPVTRRKAAVWLGEAGEPTAISALRQAYLYDSDPKVREAAAYSLGMFRALEAGLAGDDQDEVFERLQNIVINRAFGSRLSIPTQRLAQVAVGLLTSLVLLLVFTFVVWPSVLLPQLTANSEAAPVATVAPTAPVSATEMPADAPPAATDDPLSAEIANLDAVLAEITGANGAYTRLNANWQAAANGDTRACAEAAPTIPDDYTTAAGLNDAGLNLAVDVYNSGLALLRRAGDQYRQGCEAGNLAAVAASGTSTMSAATAAFDTARTQLDSLR